MCLSLYPGTSSRRSSRQNSNSRSYQNSSSQSREGSRSRQISRPRHIQRSCQILSARSLWRIIPIPLVPCTWWCNTTVAQQAARRCHFGPGAKRGVQPLLELFLQHRQGRVTCESECARMLPCMLTPLHAAVIARVFDFLSISFTFGSISSS